MINKRCLSCDYFRDACNGKPGECVRYKPIDFEKDTVTEIPTLKRSPTVGQETRQQKFDRIGGKRQQQALEAIHKLEHLTARYHRTRTDVTAYTYAWTAEQALALIRPIEAALETLKSELIACDIPREHGLIETE